MAARMPGLLGALLLVSSGGLLLSCQTGSRMRGELTAIQEDLKVAHEQRADRCAPRALALAETNAEFAAHELDQGDAMRAREHLQIALKNSKQAVKNSVQCKPVKVVVKTPVRARVVRTDRDGDGVEDVKDRCPDIPGPVANQGCPVPKDSDGDGILDEVDQCRMEREDYDEWEDDDGCPEVDNDQDGILDRADRCPNVAGPVTNGGCPVTDKDGDGVMDPEDECVDVPGPKENKGCPWKDSDGDGLVDPNDKCPHQAGPKDNNGCPKYKLIVVNAQAKKIEIKQKVYFQTGKARIQRRSNAMLNEIADVLTKNPKMKIIIEGHTDSVGSDSYNLRLSDRRAKSVRQYLIDHGVEAERLKAVGYGESRPIASNKTRRGREQNRRVEFKIAEE